MAKIAFIICVNNELYFQECSYYINRLTVPEGFQVEVIGIYEADSICSAYNAGMRDSDAKYKIYMHQDVMIRNPHFLENVVEIFAKNAKVGMIGMVGGTEMPKTGVTYRAWNVGKIDFREPDMAYWLVDASDPKEGVFVEAVDGVLIATQYDIPWREDLFTHFDFYDISQSFEMRKAGYQILVPYQETPWVIHDSGFVKLTYYDEERKKCLKEYSEYLYAEGGFDFHYDKEWSDLSDLLAEQTKNLFVTQEWEQIGQIIEGYHKAGRKSSELETLSILYNIYEKEKNANVKTSFFDGCTDYQSIYKKYNVIRFLLRRMELGFEIETYQELVNGIRTEQISYEALMEMMLHSTVDKKTILKKIAEVYDDVGMDRYGGMCRELCQKLEGTTGVAVFTEKGNNH